jgi:SAM-dependent methyltransferase
MVEVVPGGSAQVARPFPWPTLPGDSEVPVWTGHGFQVGSTTRGVLAYTVGDSGWTDDLTVFHEDTAGSNHPIDRASRASALAQIESLGLSDPVVLDAGCSSGFFVQEVRRRFPLSLAIGADFVSGPLELLADEVPDLPLLQFDLRTCPLPDACLDAVVLLNVLEHIDDDLTAMRQVQRILRPGGLAILEVPAGPELYDVYDELLMHHRRYRMRDLQALVRRSGLDVIRASHLGALIYPPFYLVKQWNKRYLSRDRAAKQQVVAENIRSTSGSPVLEMVLRLELALGRRINWPVGIRCLVTGRKPVAGR